MTLSQGRWQDPAKVAERDQLNKLGCKACVKHQKVNVFNKQIVICADSRMSESKLVPKIGHKCKYFREC